jgi:hypothetical protein
MKYSNNQFDTLVKVINRRHYKFKSVFTVVNDGFKFLI